METRQDKVFSGILSFLLTSLPLYSSLCDFNGRAARRLRMLSGKITDVTTTMSTKPFVIFLSKIYTHIHVFFVRLIEWWTSTLHFVPLAWSVRPYAYNSISSWNKVFCILSRELNWKKCLIWKKKRKGKNLPWTRDCASDM